eukprot:5598480-Prymnesium_polylepis.1
MLRFVQLYGGGKCCANGTHPLVITIGYALCHSAPSNGGDDGHDRRPSRTIRCMLVTDHDHHGVSVE